MTLAEFINKVGFKVNQEDVQKVNNTISNIKSTATKALGLLGIGISLSQLNAIAEEFNGINDKLNYALEYSEDMKDVQKEILTGANRCRVSYSNMVDTVVSLKQANADVFPVNEAATFVEYLNKLGKSAGYSDGEISSMQNSIQRVVAAGVMGASDITRMARQTPALVEKLCEGLGVTREELNAMAEAGQITASTLKDAIMNSSDSIDASFDKLDYSISDAMLNIRNQWGYFVDDLNASTGLSQTIAKAMVSAFTSFMGVLNRVRNGIVWLTDKLGGMENVLKIVAIAAAATFAVMNFSKVTSGLSSIMKILGKIQLKTLAIIAVIVLVALLVEDFINFMQGNDSLIGSLFEKAGIDADAARQTILEAWGKVKTFLLGAWDVIKKVLPEAWNAIKGAAQAIFGALSDWWEQNGEAVMASFSQLWEGIKNLCITLWNALSSAATAIFEALKSFWDQWGSTILSVFSIIWNTLISLIQPFLDAIAAVIDFLANVFTGNWEGAWQAVKDIAANIWQMLVTIINGAWEAISTVWSVVVGFFSGIFQNIWDAIVEKVTGIKDTIVNGFTEAIDWIKSLPEQALQWGADIINGIVDGIKGAIGGIGDAVAGVADKIKSFLGFSEPDEGPLSDFHTYMPDMIKLMAQGIQRGKEVIKAAAKDLAGGLTDGMEDEEPDDPNNPKPKGRGVGGVGKFLGGIADGMSALAGAGRPQPSTVNTVTGSNNVSRSVVQNVEINNKFQGDSAIQRQASGAMDKSAKDVTAELARGLAFAK